jgi:hypothetical protein
MNECNHFMIKMIHGAGSGGFYIIIDRPLYLQTAEVQQTVNQRKNRNKTTYPTSAKVQARRQQQQVVRSTMSSR